MPNPDPYNASPEVWDFVTAANLPGMFAALGIPQPTVITLSGGSTEYYFFGGIIPDGWKNGNSDVAAVAFGVSITHIGQGAFYGTNLTSLTLPPALEVIVNEAFAYCASITGPLVLPDSLLTIGASAFKNCTGITSVSVGSGLTTLLEGAFEGCTSLATFTVDPGNTSFKVLDGAIYSAEESVLHAYPAASAGASFTVSTDTTTILAGAFAYASSLQAITLPAGLSTIGAGAFSESALANVTIPLSVSTLPFRAFKNCGSLETVSMSSVQLIGAQAFMGCGLLNNVHLAYESLYVLEEAFANCSTLTWMFSEADPSLGAISSYAFTDSPGYLLVRSDLLPNYGSVGSDFNGRTLLEWDSYPALTPPALPTTAIYDEFDEMTAYNGFVVPSLAFSGNANVNRVVADIGVLAFAPYSFSDCVTLTMAGLMSPNMLVDDYAMSSCPELSSVYAESGVSFGAYAFYNSGASASFKRVHVLPAEWLSYGGPGAAILDYMIVPWVNYPDFSSPDAPLVTLYGVDGAYLDETNVFGLPNDYRADDADTYSASFSDGLVLIGEIAFRNTPILAVSLPASVVHVGDSAFENCDGLKELVIYGAADLRPGAFSACNALSHIFCAIPFDDLPSAPFAGSGSDENPGEAQILVPTAMLASYGGLSAQLGTSNYYVGEWANYPDPPQSPYTKAYVGSGLAYLTKEDEPDIGNSAAPAVDTIIGGGNLNSLAVFSMAGSTAIQVVDFAFCSGLLAIPNGAFENCSSLSSVILPPALTTIGDVAFMGCNLAAISFPATLTTIGVSAFEGSVDLNDFELGADLTSVGALAFAGCGVTSFTALCPAAAIDSTAFYNCPGGGTLYVSAAEAGGYGGVVSFGAVLDFTVEAI